MTAGQGNGTRNQAQFYRAIADLSDTLVLTNDQRRMLYEWFKNHVFEFGQDYMVSEFEAQSLNDMAGFMDHIKRKLSCGIGENIMQKGMMQFASSDDLPHATRFRASVLVCVAPPVVGKPTIPERDQK